MPFQVTCPNCLKILELSDSLLGKKVRCGSCQQIFLIGQPNALVGAGTPAKNLRTSAPESSPQIQRTPRPAVVLRPAEEMPAPPRARRVPRRKIPIGIWIAAGCAAGVFGLVTFAVLGFLGYRMLAYSKTSDALAAGVQPALQPPARFQPDGDPQEEAPPQQRQPADLPPANPPPGMPRAGMPPGARPPGGMPPWARRPPANHRPPDNNRPPEKNTQRKFPVALSNGRVGAAVGFRRSFTISYRFEEGEPAPGQHYFVVIKTPNGSAEAHITPFRIGKEGTFHLQEIGFGARDDGPFEIHLETGLPGPLGPRQVVSNTIKLTP